MSIRHELRWATRTVTRHPAFSLLVIATFAVGIALNLVVAAMVDSLLFRAAPGVQSRDAVAILGTGDGAAPGVLSYRDLVDYRDQSRTLAHIAAWKFRSTANVRLGEDVARVPAMFVGAGYFEALGLQPARGRFIGAADDRVPNETAVVVLTDSFWRTRLGGRDVIGEDLVIDDRAFRIIGIAPPSFHGTVAVDRADLFVPMMMLPYFMRRDGSLFENRGWSGVYGVARLRPGSTMEAAQAELSTIAKRLEKAYPGSNAGVGVALMPLSRAALAPQARAAAARTAAVLAVVTLGALFLICANIANLFIGRAVARGREMAVRAMLGAGRWGVARQMALESLLLAACGAAAGLMLARFGVTLLQTRIPQMGAIALTPATVLLVPLLALLAGLTCGIVPVIAASTSHGQRMLRATAGSTSRGTHRMSSMLVALQVAVSVVLLTAFAFFAVTLKNLGEAALGFDGHGVVAAELAIRSGDQSHVTALERVRAMPTIETASLGSVVPLSGSGDTTQALPDGAPRDRATRVSFYVIASDYFRVLRIPLLRGRDLSNADGATAPPVVVINDSLARRFWPDGNAVGQRLRLVGEGAYEIVGVVADSNIADVRSDLAPTVYFHHAQSASLGSLDLALFARTASDAPSAARELRAALAEVGVSVGQVAALDQLRSDAAAPERMMSTLIGVVAALALAIAALGLYGVLSLSIAQRTREIGIRMALGAIPGDLVRSTMFRGALLAFVGFVAGGAVVAAGGRLLTPFLFGTRITDPAPWVMVLGFVALSVLIATYVPARRASRVQPAIALRHE